MESDLICRACLVTNVKMYNMQTLSIFTAYIELTGISDIGVYTHICYECVAVLRKCRYFRLNCFKAHETLSLMVNKQVIQRDHKEKSLESRLRQSDTNVISISSDKSQTNDKNAIDYVEIKVESDGGSINRDLIKCESTENTKQEFKDDDNIASDFEDDSSPSDSIPRFDKKQKLKKVTTKSKKRKVASKRVRKLDLDSNDDVPLLKLCKTEKKKTVKSPKVSQNKDEPRFDVKSFEEYATVIPLTTEEARKEVELRKESSNYKNCTLKCNFCFRGYESKNAFNNHMKKHSLASGKHECEICHLRFPKRLPYTRHMYVCHKWKFCCKTCPFIAFTSYQANSHMNLHKGVKFTCEMCLKVFSKESTFYMHKRIKHPTEIVCALCGSTFATEKGLKTHNALMHKQESNEIKGPQCVECDVHFATETAWKRHLVLSAKHAVSNGCEICGDTFGDALTLKRHVKSHGVAALYTRPDPAPVPRLPANCSVCSKWLTSRDEFKTHMTTQHPDSDVTRRIHADDNKPCVCEFCGKGFKKRCFMIYHQRKHTGERPYTCDVCKKTFAFPGSLSVHKKVHSTKIVMFKCDLCEKMFKTKLSLSKHVKRTHLNIRPHSCDVCGKAFQNPCEVKYHKQHVHGNVPWPKRDRSKRNRNNEEQADLIINYN